MELRTDSVTIITGGGGAIAGAVAEVFAAAGARLALVDVDEAAVRERAAALGALALAADLGSMSAAAEMVAAVRRKLGRVDALIHTAGAFAMAPAHAFSDELFDRMLTVNLRTLCAATCAVLPGFVEQGRGFVAGFSSGVVWDGRGGEGMSVYAAAKAAVASYLRSVEAEYRGRGVTAAVVYPLGAVDTPANRRAMPDANPAGFIDPTEIGHALLFAATRGPRGRLAELAIGAA
jgi:NADP-dependent 3-hydroxy acid dehydrogenase YdfG